jgi:hypothetical protein
MTPLPWAGTSRPIPGTQSAQNLPAWQETSRFPSGSRSSAFGHTFDEQYAKSTLPPPGPCAQTSPTREMHSSTVGLQGQASGNLLKCVEKSKRVTSRTLILFGVGGNKDQYKEL